MDLLFLSINKLVTQPKVDIISNSFLSDITVNFNENIFNYFTNVNSDLTIKFIVSFYFNFLVLFNIEVLSFFMLMVLIIVFINNYKLPKNVALLILLRLNRLFLIILIFYSFYSLVVLSCTYLDFVSFNESFQSRLAPDYYKFFIILFMLFILLAISLFAQTVSLKSVAEFILLSFIVIYLSILLLDQASKDLALFLICLEGFSLSVYIMATMGRTFGGISASIKYFTFGTLGSISMLWGSIIIYDIIKSLDSSVIIQFIHILNNNFYAIETTGAILNKFTWAFILIIVGFLIKLGAAPSHQWIPDVYAGVPLIVMAFYAIIVKFILFILFLEWAYSFNTIKEIEYAAILSIVIGCFGTLRQTEIKRFLAYSSITHTGYLLIGDLSASFMYISSYILASLLFFSLLLNLRINNKEFVYLTDLRYIGQTDSQFHKIILVIILSSMAGLPPFAGFYGKMFVWNSLIEDLYIYNDFLSFLVFVVNLFTSLLIIFYYIRIMGLIYINDEKHISVSVNYYQLSSINNVNSLNKRFLSHVNLDNNIIKYLQIIISIVLSLWTIVMPFITTLLNVIL